MAKIIRTTGEIEEKEPKDGKVFQLEELQEIVGGYIEEMRISLEQIMIMNEEGRLKGLPVNEKASSMVNALIVGDVLVCNKTQIR